MNLPLPNEEAQSGASTPGVPAGGVPPGGAAGARPGPVPFAAASSGNEESAPLGGGQGLGPTLLSLREARRISRNEVSARVKYSVRQIEALETEQWDRLPDGVALRGFVKNYGRYLEADVEALLTMLDEQAGVAGARAATVAAVAQVASMGPAELPLHGDAVRRPWGWLAVILVLLFVAGFYAIGRGWVPDAWLVFDWLKSLKS